MEFIEAVLSTEVLAGILIIGAFAMSIRSILHFTGEAAELRPKLTEVERELTKLRDNTKTQKKKVENLNRQVAPIKEMEAKVRMYYEQLQEINIDHEKREQKQSAKEQAERRKRIQRTKMGMSYEGADEPDPIS